MQTAQSLEGRLANLTSRYIATMPDRVSAIAETLTRCRHESLEAAPILERQFHTLAGTAGTFGLHALSAVAAEAEETCAGIEGPWIDEESLTYLNYLVENLRVLSGDFSSHPDERFPVIAEGNAVAQSGEAVV